MEECVNEISRQAGASEKFENRALDLVCKNGYTRDALIKELKMNSSDLKIRIRKELSKYRKLK